VTSDNPRTEEPAKIIADILGGMRDGSEVIEDRDAAIAHAVAAAASDDVVLLAGKGHEYFQIIGNERLRFSDTEVAQTHLIARHAKQVRAT